MSLGITAVIQSLLACPAVQIFSIFSGVSFSNSSNFTILSNVYLYIIKHLMIKKKKDILTGAEDSKGNFVASVVTAALGCAFVVFFGSTFLGVASLAFLAACSLILFFSSSTVIPSLREKERDKSSQYYVR